MFSLLQNTTPAAAQQQQPAPGSADAKPEVGASQPIITIHGLCGQSGQKTTADTKSCSKVITREQFEKMMAALNPGGQQVSASGRQNLAQAWVEVLAFEEAAKNAGTEDTPQFREVMDWMRLRTIADLYRRNLLEQVGSPTQAEIDAYYEEHRARYERVKLLRILAPRESFAGQGFSGQDKDEFDKKALAAAQAAHQRAIKGEDFDQIQKDVYAGLGISAPPVTDLGAFGRADFIEKEAAEVFSLQPGEVSQLQIEIKSYVIYKVISKTTLPEAQVKAEIAREIAQQKYKAAIKAVMDSAQTEFNEQYFGPMAPRPPDAPAMPRRSGH